MVETKADDNAKDSVNNDYNAKTLDEKKIEKDINVKTLDEKKIEKDINEKIHDEEKNIEIESKDDYVLKMISAAANTNDDLSLPCLTFRFWVLSTKFYIKNWEFSLNPGPFNYKEHVCIAAAALAGGVSAYAVSIISIQELYYNTHVNFLVGFLLLISTQMIGYGLAGFARKYLVYPTNMIWPQSLVYATMYNTLHGNTSETNDKLRIFYIAFISIFVWQFIPEYMFTWLSSAAILCLIAPNNDVAKTLGSAYKGAGILAFSFDWNAVSSIFPLYTPWWSQVNHLFGIVLATWIIAPLLYYNNIFDAQKFPFLSTRAFDKYGEKYNQTRIMDPTTNSLDVTANENYSPIFMSIMLAACYGYTFMQIPATICHVILFHGKEIWNQFKKTREEENESDIHCKMMSVYPEVPNYWYGAIFFIMLIIAVILGHTSGANLPWWGVFLAVSIAVITLLPIGIIQAISNWQIALSVIVELVCGFILPGRAIANVYFRTYGYMCLSQCLYFVQDLKLGHYMKVPPRSMFTSQIWGTFVGVIVNYWTMQLIIDTKRSYLDGTEVDPSGQWTGLRSGLFNTASIIWGLIGPAKTFGYGSPYNILLWGFLIGGFLPIPFYLLHRKFPNAKFNLVNIPVIFHGLTLFPSTLPNFIVTGFIVSFLSQFYAFRYKEKLWKKYNYVMSAAFDSGSQIMTMVLFICFTGIAQVKFPVWWGNDPSSQGEHCFYS
ncbi:OPT oligopeptide transporter protein [Gigaspora rosea]|uniref:OPT oligopeptide transporter protein n=1 Tax=Gigaspora rosea TaxID=44941 RepID=A0A397UVG4_9GLOM|nr:OPT oligopeptide transporter protein [Gigaspora rosea]